MSPPTSFPSANLASHQHAYTVAWCHVITSDYQGGTKPDYPEDILAIDYCRPTNTIFMGRASSKGPFFFVYSCLLSDLHLALRFDDFTMGVLQSLNVAPSQLHPNTWASLQIFWLICDKFGLRTSPSTFLHYYTSHLADHISWLSLASRSGNILFAPLTSSYKNFKGKFFKKLIEPKGRELSFYELGQSKFPLYWTRTPTRFKK